MRPTTITGVLIGSDLLSTAGSLTLAAVLPLIGISLGVGAAALGVLLAAQLLGFAALTLPAGFLAGRIGNPRTFLLGLVLEAGAFLALFLPVGYDLTAVLLFLSGSGYAITGVGLVALVGTVFPPGQRGPAIGVLLGSSLGLGGLVGLPAAAYLGVTYGYPVAFLTIGLLLVAVAAIDAILLMGFRDPAPPRATAERRGRAARVLRSRSLWAIGLSLSGFSAGSYVPVYFLGQYFHDVHPGWGIVTAAHVVTVGTFATLPGALVGGWLGDRGIDRRLIVGGCAVPLGVAIVGIPFYPLLAFWLVYAIVGAMFGVGVAVTYLIPTYLPESSGENLALATALVGGLELSVTGAWAFVFGFVVEARGYAWGWTLSGLLALGLLPLLFLVRPNRGTAANRGVAE